MFLGAAAIVVVPWYAKTWVMAGNPVWPFFAEVLGGRFGAEWVELGPRFYDWQFWTWPPNRDILFNHGPQFLLVPAAAALLAASRGEKIPPVLKFLLAPAIPYFLMLLGHNDAWRYFLSMLPALAMAAGWGIDALLKRKSWLGAAALAAALFGLWPITSVNQNNELFAVLGVRSSLEPQRPPRTIYLERTLNNYRFYMSLNETLPVAAKVLLFREIRGYYLDRDYLWGDPFNQALIRYDRITSPTDLRRQLAGLGVTHVLINEGLDIYRPSLSYYTPRLIELMDETLRAHARPALSQGALTLYELKTSP